jgi:RNA polymerase sigma-70 factor (ECF subfamily)
MSPSPPHRSAEPSGAAERALLASLRAGDRAAFDRLVTRHGGTMLHVAMTFVRDRAVAEDVVQDTWLALLDGLDGFEERASLKTWLFGILVNKARTRAVREGRSLPFSALAGPDDAEGPGDLPDRFDGEGGWRGPPGAWSEDDPEQLAQAAETRVTIEAAIAALPEAQRAVVTLRDVEGLEADEICELLGISLTNQRVILHRARVRLRRALEDHLR